MTRRTATKLYVTESEGFMGLSKMTFPLRSRYVIHALLLLLLLLYSKSNVHSARDYTPGYTLLETG